jgi:hypothetical protein
MKVAKRLHHFCLVSGFALLAFFSFRQMPPAHAQGIYGSKIVAPEREDTPRHPDMILGPAIKDLQSALKQMTSRDFTVARGDKEYSGAGIYLLLTESPNAPTDVVEKLKGKGREPFVIRSKDEKNLLIVSNGEQGLSHGIYFYLEQLGCHWFMPNEHWTVIPTRQDIAVKMDRLVAPVFKYREYAGTGGYGPAAPYDPKYDSQNRLQFRIRTEDWQRRNRFGGEFHLDGHAGEAFNIAHKDVLIAHPEYLAEVGGKRVWSEIAKLDASNPDAVKLWVDDRVATFRAARKASPNSPYSFAVSVDPADGGGFCTCDKCRAKFQANGENDATFYSNQVFYLANEVAKAVRKEFPDGFVNLYGYADHSAPPSIPLEPNVYVSIIPYGFNYSGLQPNDFIDAWGKKTRHISVYDYWSIPDWTWDLPTFNYLETPKDKIGYWSKHNVEGFLSESTYGAGAMGIGWYLSSRLMWDPNANQDAILSTFYTKSFGPAAPPMKRMMERWARSFLLSSQEIATSFRDVQEAETLAANNPAVQARVDDMAKYLQYLRLYLEYSSATDPKLKLEADKKLIEHLFDIYDTNMVHSFRIYQFLVDYGRNLEAFNEFQNEKADAPGWKRIAPLSHDEVSTLIADGVKQYQPLDFEMKAFGGKWIPLKPVTNIAIPADDNKWGTRMATRGGLDVQIEAPASLKKLPLRVNQYYDITITVTNAQDKEIFKRQIKGIKEYEKAEEFEVTLPAAGRYTIKFRPVSGGGFWFQTLPGVPLAFGSFLAEMGAPSPRLYFYVPRGLKTIAFWLNHGDFNGNYPQVVKDPEGNRVPIESHDGGKLVMVKVPAGQDAKVWSLESVRSPDAPIRMLNVPSVFGFSPETLLLPEDALK